MRAHLRVAAGLAVGLSLGVLGLFGTEDASAVIACAWARAGAAGSTTTVVVVNENCPPLPPPQDNNADPCPAGSVVRINRFVEPTTGAIVHVLACVGGI